jgi:trans-2-enoyl-CoA reductase
LYRANSTFVSRKIIHWKCPFPVDEKGRIRIDDWEMREDVQEKIAKLWGEATTENLSEIGDLEGYRKDFYNLFGFDLMVLIMKLIQTKW